MSRPVPRPTAVEVLANLLLGVDDGAPEFPESLGLDVHAALEQAMLPALQRSPCMVSFSGGRDSSAVLAMAVQVARRHGLPDPVPAIKRYPDAPDTHETTWQELVLDHLALRTVEVLEVREEVDALGEAATRVVRRHGVRWPGNAYMHVPVFELARGGAVLTGVGGDELFATTGARHVLLARGRVRPRLRDVTSLAALALPRAARERLWVRRRAPAYPWLTAEGAALVQEALARDEIAAPARWDVALRHWHRSRAFAAVSGALGLVGSDHDVMVVNPLLDGRVLAALHALGGATGFPSRSDAMRRLFRALLPDTVLTRETKAGFTTPVWGPAVRAFAARWRGQGVDARYADADLVRHEWLSPSPDFRTILLLHQAWAHAHTGADQPSVSSS